MTNTLPVYQFSNKLYKILVKVVQVVPGKAADLLKLYVDDGSGERCVVEAGVEASRGCCCVVTPAPARRPRPHCCVRLAAELESCDPHVGGVLLRGSGYLLVLQDQEHSYHSSTGSCQRCKKCRYGRSQRRSTYLRGGHQNGGAAAALLHGCFRDLQTINLRWRLRGGSSCEPQNSLSRRVSEGIRPPHSETWTGKLEGLTLHLCQPLHPTDHQRREEQPNSQISCAGHRSWNLRPSGMGSPGPRGDHQGAHSQGSFSGFNPHSTRSQRGCQKIHQPITLDVRSITDICYYFHS